MRKLNFFIPLLVCVSMLVTAQKVATGVSETKFVSITKDPPKPPYLEIEYGTLTFGDTDGNNKINANETTNIRFILNNTGMGPGLDLKVKIEEQNHLSGLNYEKEYSIGGLEVGKTQTIEIPVSGNMNLEEGTASFKIWINEANGFGIDPVYIDVTTQSFVAPMVKIVDYKVSSQSGSSLLKRKPFDLQVMVQNVGQGAAENVRLRLPVPENVFCLSANETVEIGTLAPGEKKLMDFNLVTNNQYNAKTIPFDFQLIEKHNKYTENKSISLTLNQQVSNKKLVITGQEAAVVPIVIGSLTSDVDKDIPTNIKKNSNRIALIFGNEDYSGSLNAEINVKFAINDAQTFRQYALNTLGVEQKNTYFNLNATAGTMNQQIQLVTEIIKRLGSDAELIFYYAGHGYPDEGTKIPYLIPVDVNATNLTSAIKLLDIYEGFGATGAKRITVFLDACFSGGGRDQGLLAARSISIKPKEETPMGNMIVFSASSDKQTALPYDKEKHGMFSYFLFKKIKDTEGNVTYGELSDYLINTVGIESLRENQKSQDPEVNVSPDVSDTWMDWTVK